MRPSPATIRQLVKYGVVGISNTLITLAIYALCTDALGVQYEVALTLGFAVGTVNGYVLNRRWTFQATASSHARAVRRYTGVQLIAYLTNLFLLHAAVSWLGLEKNIAEAIVIPVVFLATYLPNRIWSFGEPTPV
ncbi:MAG: GtrA family protein [Solirubrobacteraceae bacterium]